MDSETVDTVTGWTSESFEGGYAGLHDLASREFTGAVTDGTAWLFVLNGRVVGVADGDIETFADADGTAYLAPDPSLPLLFAMRETGGETRGKYYTNDTPLSEVDETLSAGNFTGYIALSENVLSGDYYVVYHGGHSLACAFIGTTRRTLTGDEAFERATDEVGIYEVHEVDVSVVDIPDAPDEAASDGAADANGADTDAGGTTGPTVAGVAGTEPTDADGTDSDETDANESAPTAEARDAAPDTEHDVPGGVTIDSGTADPAADGDEDDSDVNAAPVTDDDAATVDPVDGAVDDPTDDAADTDPAATPDPESDDDPAPASTTETNADPETAENPMDATADPDTEVASDGDSGADDADTSDSTDDGTDGDAADTPRRSYARSDGDPTDAVSGSGSDPFSAEEQWRETRSIPSLDPADAGGPAVGAAANPTDPVAAPTVDEDESAADPDDTDEPTTGGTDTDREREQPAADLDAPDEARTHRDEARAELDDTRAELAETRSELEAARAALDAVRGDLETSESEAARLRERVDELETELAAAREETERLRERTPDVPNERTIPADRALAGTNLFVRYDSKSGPTLEDARTATAGREEVNANLRLERHTDFETEGAVVDGRPFGEFLADSLEYEFVEWVVRDLVYEIAETRNESALRGLFTALPKVDRAQLHGTVDLGDDARPFDVVLRDRMGTPLVVANVTDSRDPTAASALDGLVEGGSAVVDRHPDLGGAFHVSASFFEPGALEAAADATGGGLLGRGKQKSFVRLSRKQGFHLCLVEARDGEFHITVPEL